MTNKEAIEILEEVKELDDSMFQFNPSYMEALSLAIEALKRMKRYNTLPSYEEVMNNMKKMDADKLQRKFLFWERRTDDEGRSD